MLLLISYVPTTYKTTQYSIYITGLKGVEYRVFNSLMF